MMAKELSRLLAQRAEEIARYLLPNGKRDGNEWHVGSINGEKGQSLAIHLNGEKAGVWCDFASGDKGDLLDLWAATRHLTLTVAIKEAGSYLGIAQPKFEAHRPLIFAKPKMTKQLSLQSNSPVRDYLINERKLTVNTIEAFQVNGDSKRIIFPYIRDKEIVFIKYLNLDRVDGKKQISVEPNCEPCLFGWHLIPTNTRSITLCEGEIDCMTLHQYGIAALSVPFGAGTGDKHRWLEYEFDRLVQYDEIFLCLDQDHAGKAAAADLIERLGRYRCRLVTLPYKDANECLQKGIATEQMQQCFIDALTLDPAELKRARDFVLEVIGQFYPPNGQEPGYLPPWDKAKGKVLFRPNELSIWFGICGHGKSQFLGHIMLSSMQQGARVCIASLELKPRRLLMRLTRQAAGLTLPSEEFIHAIHEWYGDKLWLFDLVGTAKSDRLLEVFLYARQRYGIDVFVIDSFMKLDIAEDDYNAQKAFIEKLCDFKNSHDCHIHIIVHPRKADDESSPPCKLDIKGSGSISDLADNCFAVWRNKSKEEAINLQKLQRALTSKQQELLAQADCLWICDKQRNGEWEGKIGLWFDAASFQYLNYENQRAAPFVAFSTAKYLSVDINRE